MTWLHRRMHGGCPCCGSLDVRHSHRENLFEKVVLRLLLLRTFRCKRCGQRYYDLILRPRARVLPHEASESASVEAAAMLEPSPSLEPSQEVEERKLDRARNREMSRAGPEMWKMAQYIESRGPAGVALNRLTLAFKQLKKNDREGCIRGLIEGQTVRCFIRQVSGRRMGVFVHKEHVEEHARRYPDDAPVGPAPH